ncbi:PLP-dependent aminotransferase family protein [Oscillibacter sp.]|uniref:MocR-like pyridoxine biosynthesis transcription factor PdxR n=1 Tax=Oscillibacter sp. TaxID=1945593 RepID=UPI002635890F|nr:PLP-dependent aminotransferase family protein [Oscillibacter sp.]MDD3346350.1 PLP-dependent aminotransferase family protein [Oscillibacter sp.]
MLTYAVEDRGSLPLYEYLYRCIRQDILRGVLTANQRLPSKRQLADHLRLSVITVENAYAQLEAEGYLYTLPRRGFFVSRVEQAPAASSPAPVPTPPEARTWRLDLTRNQVDGSKFPVSTWARLTRQVLSEGDAFFAPMPHQGLLLLRQAIAQDLRDFKGMAVSPEQIVVGAGAEYLYLLLAQLLGAQAVFALEDPGYPKIRQVYAKCGAVCRPVPMDRQGISLSALNASGATAAHISPAHHYPTGIVTPIARRQALLRWAEERNGIIIEDDYDSEFRFAGRPLPTLQSIDTGGRVIYMNTFSQTISRSMRIGFMVLPPHLLEQYRRELDFYACTVPALEQHVLSRFLSGGYFEQHLSRMRKEYRARRGAVLDAFRTSPFARRVTISEQGSGLHFLLRLSTTLSDEDLRRRAEGHGVRLGFLSSYAALPHPEYAHTLVVNYAALDPSQLAQAMALLADVFAETESTPPPDSASFSAK